MRLLIDECCPRAFAETLRREGHDIVYVADFGAASADVALAQLADADGRVIISQDCDFGELAIRQGVPATGVVLMTCYSLSVADRCDRLCGVISDLGQKLLGAMTVVELRRVRQRSLRPSN
jgi:predicted nuclease of predicted toxin-antitoxin system